MMTLDGYAEVISTHFKDGKYKSDNVGKPARFDIG